MKKLFCFLLPIFLLVMGLCHNFSYQKVYGEEKLNYAFSVYNVNMQVHLNNTYTITETADVSYGAKEDGLVKTWVRKIPLSKTLTRTINGKKKVTKYHYSISDIKGTDVVNHYEKNGYMYLEIGSKDYVNNNSFPVNHTYIFSYVFSVGYDMMQNGDELYYPLMGNDMPVETNLFTFTIEMPKEFNSENIKFFTSVEESANIEQNIDYNVSENIISNNEVYQQYIAASPEEQDNYNVFGFIKNQGLTLHIELPEGYFSEVKVFNKNYDTAIVVASFIMVFGVLLIVVCNLIKNRTKLIDYFPPDNVTPPEGDYMTSGKLNGKSMVSLILYWASKGYVKIMCDEYNKPYAILRLKTVLPEDAKQYEKFMFRELFSNGETLQLNEQNYRASDTLNITARMAKKYLGARHNMKNKIPYFLIILLALFPLLALSFVYFVRMKFEPSFLIVGLFCYIIITSAGYLLNSLITGQHNSDNGSKTFTIISGVMLMLIVLALSITAFAYVFTEQFDMSPNLRFAVLLPIIFSAIFSFKLMPINKKYRQNHYKLHCFKKSITTMSSAQANKLIKSDTNYVYNILPYAYAFGKAKKFLKIFESLAIEPNNNFFDGNIDMLIDMTKQLGEKLSSSNFLRPISSKSIHKDNY